MFYQSLFKWIFLTSLLVMGVSFLYKDKLPEPQAYELYSLNPPIQAETAREPFTTIVNKQEYLISPKFDYELTGVVVTYNNSDGLTDIWHHDRWKDFINLRDLCVIWNPNVRSGVYQNIQFSSDSWTCWVSWNDSLTQKLFKSTALSNNHILTDDKTLKKALLAAEVGDVIHFKGVLAEYRNNKSDFFRGTSTTRNDRGNGACETVYIDEFNIIKKANSSIRKVYEYSKWLTILSLLGFVIMFFKTPHKVS